MKSKISAFMDGELQSGENTEPLAALREDGDAREAWNTYHLISDAMRDTRLLSSGFSARVAVKLAEETTVMAPSFSGRERPRPSIWALAAAASLAVVFVGATAFVMQQGSNAPPEVAAVQLPRTPPKEVAGQVSPPAAQVAPPDTANDYLLAHQGYSPRNSLQGVAPYVRMVSGEAGARKP